jgi:hypothetical protein
MERDLQLAAAIVEKCMCECEKEKGLKAHQFLRLFALL